MTPIYVYVHIYVSCICGSVITTNHYKSNSIQSVRAAIVDGKVVNGLKERLEAKEKMTKTTMHTFLDVSFNFAFFYIFQRAVA